MEDSGIAETVAGAASLDSAPKDNMTSTKIMMADDLINILYSSLAVSRRESILYLAFESCLQC